MQPGSVIYDLAASQGGNTAYTEVDKIVDKNGVKIMGEKNILNISGEKFSGKTHLANIFLSKNKGFSNTSAERYSLDSPGKVSMHFLLMSARSLLSGV